jgi:NAD(P)-dependent dehydrogenase (short-subunit alcohol dehydrogenase family)
MAKWTAADIPSQDGRTAVVTGANGGVGYHIALELARAGAHVVLACRDVRRGDEAAEKLAAEVPGAGCEVRRLDLADLDSVREFAASAPERIDLLINNAGVMAPPHRQTAQGFELQLGTNHFGHFALTGLLLSRLEAASAPRVVTTSSNMHKYATKMNWDDLHGELRYNRWMAYGQSKLANLLFMSELQRRATAAGSPLLSLAAHPGYAATDLHATGARLGNATMQERVMGLAVKLGAQSAADGALPSLYAATAPGIPPGSYVGPDRRLGTVGNPTLVRGNRASRDEAAARRLWEVSEEQTGVRYEFAGASASVAG